MERGSSSMAGSWVEDSHCGVKGGAGKICSQKSMLRNGYSSAK
jgi:hypothetical protein